MAFPTTTALQKLPVDSSSFGAGMPSTQQAPDYSAPLGGTPTVPATAKSVSPGDVAGGTAFPTNPNLTATIPGSSNYVDPSRYDPNLTFDDYYNNYHAPDRDAVLAAYPGMAKLQGSIGGSTTAQGAPVGVDGQRSFDPSQASPTTGINGGGGYPNLPAASGQPSYGAQSWAGYQNPAIVPPGFTADKWNNTGLHDPKYDAGHMLATGASDEQIGAYLQQTYPGYQYLGGDKMMGPDGATYDFDFGSGAGQHQPQWTQVAGGGAAGAGGAGGGVGGSLPPNIQTLFGPLFGQQAPISGPQSFLNSGGQPVPGGPGMVQGIGGPVPGGTGAPVASGAYGSNYTGAGDGNVGNDPLSQQITSSLMGALQSGSSPYGNQIASTLASIIGSGGVTPDITQQLIQARTNAGKAMNAQMSDADAALAARGMASTPGVAQGGAIGATERVAENVGHDYANALTDIQTHAMDLQNANLVQSLSLATGLGEDQAHNLISAIGQGTQRQSALAQIALQQLAQNQDWNKFLLNYGLDQQKLAEDISMGRMDEVAKLLQIYLQGGQTAAGGYY